MLCIQRAIAIVTYRRAVRGHSSPFSADGLLDHGGGILVHSRTRKFENYDIHPLRRQLHIVDGVPGAAFRLVWHALQVSYQRTRLLSR